MTRYQVTGELWWTSANIRQRMKLMREMGFGDVRVYAGYRWQDFQQHTRNEIDRLKRAEIKTLS